MVPSYELQILHGCRPLVQSSHFHPTTASPDSGVSMSRHLKWKALPQIPRHLIRSPVVNESSSQMIQKLSFLNWPIMSLMDGLSGRGRINDEEEVGTAREVVVVTVEEDWFEDEATEAVSSSAVIVVGVSCNGSEPASEGVWKRKK